MVPMTSLMVWVSLDIFSIIPYDFIASRKNAKVATNGDTTETQPNQPTQPQETLAMMAVTAQVKNSTGATMSWPRAFNFCSS